MEKITVLLASVKEREEQLKVVLNQIFSACDRYQYTLEVHLVLNFYEAVPEWIKGLAWRVTPHLNPDNQHAHDHIWEFVPDDGYVFVMDDDIYYPLDFFDKLIAVIEKHGRKAVVTCHGANIVEPAADYVTCRQVFGFSDEQCKSTTVYNDLCGVGVCAFHVSTLQPKLADFRIPFMRDLYFSILCLKENVNIVNVRRPAKWLMPLATLGTTVFDETVHDENFRALKNNVFKREFLPLWHRKKHGGNNQYVLIHDTPAFDERLMDTTLKTLDIVNPNCNIIVFSDRWHDYSFPTCRVVRPNTKRAVLTEFVTPQERAIGRMGSKVFTQYQLIQELPDEAQVLSSDADIYFLRDPFEAFNEFPEFDIGVTTRCEPYHYPLNAGIVFLRVSDKIKYFLKFVCEQLLNPNWPELLEYQKRVGHDPKNLDWDWDQDMLCTAYLMRDKIKERFGIRIEDVGPYWNFAPHADGPTTESGKSKLMKAFHDESVAVLHLKSRLKELLYSGLLPY